MIFDNISNRRRYSFDSDITALLDRMAEITPETFPDGRLQISDTAFINPSRFVSSPSKGRYEEHKRYADIHFILEGSEKITIEETDRLIPAEEYSAEKDIGFHTGSGGTVFVLKPGDFLICYPGEVHEPGVCPESAENVLKLVGKFEA